MRREKHIAGDGRRDLLPDLRCVLELVLCFILA